MKRARQTADSGFTLIELLISIAITSLIVGVLATALKVSFADNNAINARYTNANGSLSLTNLFPTDIASTPPGGREVDPLLPSECGDPAGTLNGNVIRLTWDEAATGPPTWYRVSYRLSPQSDGTTELLRVACTSTTGPHDGYGTADIRRVAQGLVAKPAGWDSTQPPARVLCSGVPCTPATIDDPNLSLELTVTTGGAVPSTFIVAGNRVNPASTIPAGSGPVATPAIRATTATTATSYVAVDEEVPFTTRVLNAGTTRLDAIAVTDPAATCDRSTLAPGVTADCTYVHAVTQEDLDAGVFSTAALASGTPPSAAPLTARATAAAVNANQNPSLSVIKTIDGPDTYTASGALVRFHVEAKNTGNVTVLDLSFADPKADIGSIGACGAPTLAPGATLACDFVYTIQGFDLGFGSTIFGATTVTGTFRPLVGPNTVVGVSNSTTLRLDPQPAMTAEVGGPTPGAYTAAGVVITYPVTVTNTGNVGLNTVVVTDPRNDDGPIPVAAATLNLSQSATCTVSHTVTDDEVAHPPVSSAAVATANPTGALPPISAVANVITIGLSTSSAITISKTVVTSPGHSAQFTLVGDVVQFALTVTNTGTTPLTAVAVSDPVGTNDCAAGAAEEITALAPGEAKGCVVTKTIVAADIGHDLTNTATVSATSPEGPVVATSNTATVTFVADPQLTVSLSASPFPTFSNVGDQIVYTAVISNTGIVPLSAVGIVAQTVGTGWNCASTTLAPGAQTTCTGSYQTRPVDATGSVSNVVTASGTYGGVTRQATSPSVTVSSVTACSIVGLSTTPSFVRLDGTPAHHLQGDVSVNVSAGGTCSGLQVRYFPTPFASVKANMTQNPGGWSYFIPTAADSWDTGGPITRDVTIDILDSNGNVLPGGTGAPLTVSQ